MKKELIKRITEILEHKSITLVEAVYHVLVSFDTTESGKFAG